MSQDRSDSLIVPIDLEALCIGADEDGLRHRGATADFSSLPSKDDDGEWTGKPYIGESIASLPQMTREPGIHLHWALPDALTKGIADAQGGLRFPPVPTRWLVMRIVTRTDPAKNPEFAGFVVESDFQHADPTCATVSVPYQPADGRQFHRYLGRSVPLADWQESGDPGERFGDGRPLTVLGYGDTIFSAYYPNCRNVFGFHDPLQDLADFDAATGDRLAYLVAGWYPDPTLEPRLDLPPEAGGLAWSWPDTPPSSGAAAIAELPGRVICSGLVRAIAWDAESTMQDDVDSPLEIAIGNTQADCVSALLANRPNLIGDPEAAFLLDAVQAGVLADTVAADFHVTLDHTLHASTFATTAGEMAWQIAAAGQTGDAEGEPSGANASVSAGLAERLASVNGLEADFARALADLASRRDMLVLDWRHLMQVLHATDDQSLRQVMPDFADPDSRSDFSANLRTLLETESAALSQEAARLGKLTRPLADRTASETSSQSVDRVVGEPAGSVAAALAAAIAELARAVATECGPGMALKAVPGPRFFEPVDPTILVAGADARPPVRYGGDAAHGADGRLSCRRSTQLQASLTLEGPGISRVSGGDHILFDGADWLSSIPLSAVPIAADMRLLIAEALLTDPAILPHLSSLLARRTDMSVATVAQALRPALQEAGSGGEATDPAAGPADIGIATAVTGTAATATLAGLPPAAIGRHDWQGNPWLPLFLEWEVDFLPLLTADETSDGSQRYAETAFAHRYGFDGEVVDLSPLKTAAHDTKTPVPLSGVGLLTQSAFRGLAGALGDLIARSDDRQLREAVAQATAEPVLSHALHGFNQALLARRRAVELGVCDPFLPDDDLTSSVAAQTPDRDDTRARAYAPFLPIRGGYLSMTRLSLIDVFGQERILDVGKARLARARSLTPSDPGRRSSALAELPPRLLQPARLNFRLLDASDEGRDSHAHPASSPVCGWIVVNNLDPGLALYTVDGAACGTLRLLEDGKEVVFEPMPGEDTPRIDDPHLAGFVQGMLLGTALPGASQETGRGAFLAELADVIDRSLATIIPARGNSDEAFSLLLGRPLALVRASLGVELKGRPRGRVDWQDLSRRVASLDDDGTAPPPDTLGFAAVKLPVRLGNLGQIEDGLVGYFLEGEEGTDYRRFFASAGLGRHGVEPSADNPVLVAPADRETPTRVTLLMDPFGPVHASCGLLPVKSVALPAQHYEKALSSLEASFPCGPVLATEAGLRLPLPAITGHGWSWVEADGDGWQRIDDVASLGEKPTTSDGSLAVRDGWLRLFPRLAAP